jgi:hypothetical protein
MIDILPHRHCSTHSFTKVTIIYALKLIIVYKINIMYCMFVLIYVRNLLGINQLIVQGLSIRLNLGYSILIILICGLELCV